MNVFHHQQKHNDRLIFSMRTVILVPSSISNGHFARRLHMCPLQLILHSLPFNDTIDFVSMELSCSNASRCNMSVPMSLSEI
jgi:hypothetical protein